MNTGPPLLHHCQIIHHQYLQSQTPTISKHLLTFHLQLVAKHSQINLFVGKLEFVGVLKIFFDLIISDPQQTNYGKQTKTCGWFAENLCRTWFLCQVLDSTFAWRGTRVRRGEGGTKYFCNYFFNLQRLLQLSVSGRKCLRHNKILLAARKVGTKRYNTILVVF